MAADAQPLVGQDPVGQIQAVAVQPFGVGDRADGLHDHIGRKHRPVGQDDTGHPVLALEARDPRAEGEAHAAFLVAPVQRAGQEFAERAEHRQRLGVDHRHLGDTEAFGCGGDLAADEARADDDDANARPDQFVTQAPGVGEGAHGVPAADGTRGTVAAQPARPHAGGDDQAVEGEFRTVVESDKALVEAGGGSGRAQPPLDVRRARSGREREGLERHLSGEHVLAQRWSVVRHVGLIADDRDRAGPAGCAQLFGGAQAAHRGTGHDDAPRTPGDVSRLCHLRPRSGWPAADRRRRLPRPRRAARRRGR
ncbi:hypothetical protein GCM10009646_33010 [Streptomyces aureus]